jgi:hypothetical protein
VPGVINAGDSRDESAVIERCGPPSAGDGVTQLQDLSVAGDSEPTRGAFPVALRQADAEPVNEYCDGRDVGAVPKCALVDGALASPRRAQPPRLRRHAARVPPGHSRAADGTGMLMPNQTNGA